MTAPTTTPVATTKGTTLRQGAAPTYARTPAGAPQHRGVTFARTLAAEWIKFRSLRSTVWTLVMTVVAMVAVAVLAAWGTSSMGGDGDLGSTNAVTLITVGYYLAQLPLVVLGVLVISGEYSTGMIRSTFSAVPARLPALWAKAIVTAVSAAVVGLVAVVLSFVATIPFHDELGVSLDLSDPVTLRIALGTVLYMATIALLALGFGALLRHSAAALATMLGLLLVVETVMMVIGLPITDTIGAFLPATAGGRLLMEPGMLEMSREMSDAPYLGPWQGYAVLVGWVVLVLGTAAVLLRRRDA